MGSDNLKSIEKWDNSEELLSRFMFYVLERDKDNVYQIIDGNGIPII